MTTLGATIAVGPAGEERELRILGDERRGYLLSGAADLLPNDHADADFWFEHLDSAIDAAAELGVARSQWTPIGAKPGP